MRDPRQTLPLTGLAIATGCLLVALGVFLPLSTYESRTCGIMSACDGPYTPGSDRLESGIAVLAALASLAVGGLALLPRWWAIISAGIVVLIGAPALLFFQAMSSFALFTERRSETVSGGAILLWAGLILVVAGIVARIVVLRRLRVGAVPAPENATA